MGINDHFQYLSIGLPEDILRRKLFGDFEGAIRLIDMRLCGNIPDALRKCLIVERELIARLPLDYPYSEADALGIIRQDIPDFSDEEFHAMVDEGKIDWIYVHGEPRYFDRFYQTLVKVNAVFARRANLKRGLVDGENADSGDVQKEGRLDRVVRIMKREKGRFGCRFHIRASIRIKDEAFEPGKLVRVHLPIPAEARQTSGIEILSCFPAPTRIAPADAPQRTVYWEETMEENHEFVVEYRYTNTMEYIDPMDIVPSAEQPTFYLEEQNPHIVFTPYIRELVRTLTEGMTNPVHKARAFYDFVTKNVKYSYMREYFGLENIAENCARNFRGDCGVQALLYITLCRCAGIPARWQSGLNASPDSVGAHDWAETYIAPYGWFFVDPSFGGGAERAGCEERRLFYFGNIDPYRMIANREFQAEFDPPKAHWRADPYDNQTGEVEYPERGLAYHEYERRQVMVECGEIEL